MPTTPDIRWLEWIKRIRSIAQTGLTYAHDPYDVDRYKALQVIAAEMLAAGSGVEPSVIAGLLEKETGYATPKVDMRGVVFCEDKLLMVRERSDGKWTLPGGWADVCASPAENVEREIYEESGFTARAQKILAVFDRAKHPHEPPLAFHVFKLFMLCTLTGGTAKTSTETDAISFFAEKEIPELSIGRVTPAQIRRMFEHHHQPDLPTDFDRDA
jgi:ADP-ribose pyrophosphatase YjhB (NUDIX family)